MFPPSAREIARLVDAAKQVRLKGAMEHLIEGYRIYREKRWPELRALHKSWPSAGKRRRHW